MRVVAAVKFPNRLGIDVARLRLDQRALLEVCLEQTLRADEECRAVVTVPIGVTARYNLGAEDPDLGFRIQRQRSIDGIKQHIAPVLFTWLEKAVEVKLQIFILVEL